MEGCEKASFLRGGLCSLGFRCIHPSSPRGSVTHFSNDCFFWSSRRSFDCISAVRRICVCWSCAARYFFVCLHSLLWLSANVAQLVWMHFSGVLGFCGMLLRETREITHCCTWKENVWNEWSWTTEKKKCWLIYPTTSSRSGRQIPSRSPDNDGFRTRIECDFRFFL